MTEMPPGEEGVTEADVAVVLQRLKKLRQQVAMARAASAPMKANLVAAEQEYQDHISPLRREASRIRAQINELHDRLARVQGVLTHLPGDSSIDGIVGGPRDAEVVPVVSSGASSDPEVIEKDTLLEHVYRVLDPMTNPGDAELVGQLQGLCTDPVTRLADVLEQLEWGPIWEGKSFQETPAAQCRRLQAWERALADQLTSLDRGAEQLRKDRRYGLWLQREKGVDAWRGFLEQAARQYENDIADLRAQLEALRRQWAQLVNEQ